MSLLAWWQIYRTNKMKLILQSGKEVYLEAYHCTPTYAGLLYGSPNKEINQDIIKHLKYPSEWGEKAYLVKKSDMFVSDNILKPVINCASLSSKPIDLDGDLLSRSEIIVIWFSDEQPDKTLREILVDVIGYFNLNR